MRDPIVLIPGAWTRAAAFDGVRSALEADGHPTTVLELPARARRLPQLDRGGLRAIDGAVDRLLQAHPEPPILVGHSLGGLVALRAARRHRILALVLLMPASPGGMLSTIAADAVSHPYASLRLLGAAVSATLATRLGLPPPDGLYSAAVSPETLKRAVAYRADESWAVLAALAIGSREPIAPVGAPTLVIGGLQDRITPIDVLRPLAKALAAQMIELDVAHAFNEEPSYVEVTDAIFRYLDEALR